MLRNVILAIFVLALLGVTAGALAGKTDWPPVAIVALLTSALSFERVRYNDQVRSRADEPFSPTAERFIDPESGRPVQVWTNRLGERRYVEDEGDGSA